MSDRKLIAGKFVWHELVSKDAKKAQRFYAEVLGWKVIPFPMGAFTYEMICTGDTADTMIGGYAQPKREGQPSHWISYVSVDDVDRTVEAAAANGGKVVEAPRDIPQVGRSARIADPYGAEMGLLKSEAGDAPDVEYAAVGQFFWNELHTTDLAPALAFYEKVLGISHRSRPMAAHPDGATVGPAGTYHIVSKGGVDRGGATAEMAPGALPHWLPYVHSDDVDAAAARARRLDGEIPIGPADIPGIGRFAVLRDPTGALFAIMKPLPREKQA